MCEIEFETFAFKGAEAFAMLEYFPMPYSEEADVCGYPKETEEA
jgi:hypothetical protein